MATMAINNETKTDLDLIKLCKDESYNAVIVRLIDFYKKSLK